MAIGSSGAPLASVFRRASQLGRRDCDGPMNRQRYPIDISQFQFSAGGRRVRLCRVLTIAQRSGCPPCDEAGLRARARDGPRASV